MYAGYTPVLILWIPLGIAKLFHYHKEKWCGHCRHDWVKHSACIRTKPGRNRVKNYGIGEAGTWVRVTPTSQLFAEDGKALTVVGPLLQASWSRAPMASSPS